jgi:hypothetical protein
MKIAVFYPITGAAWSVSEGVARTFERMGHTVLDCGAMTAPFEEVQQQDLVFVAGPEYLHKQIREKYPKWDELKMPRVGWLHETVEREDYDKNPIAIDGKLPVFLLKTLTPRLFTMAAQDKVYGMPFMQCAVDTSVFYNQHIERTYTFLFTGSIYEKRRKFLEEHSMKGLPLDYYSTKGTVLEYAQELNRAKIILNLPSLSEMSTARVFEAMACGSALVTPIMGGPENYSMFEHGKHLLYYTDDPIPCMKEILKGSISAVRLRRPLTALSLYERLCKYGTETVMQAHRLDQRLNKVLESI